jgi:hypothetical protein
MNETTVKRKPYGGFSLWGVPYSAVDIKFAAEELLQVYNSQSNDMNAAMRRIPEQNGSKSL